ncbi:MAG: TIGR03936 family radical SAM-associated protein [Hespellia sp.]|nr:TIGR03936 family radical SAM-associated protein [Hespellia sp.]
MKVRVKFRKNGAMRFIGHLDVMRYFQKAMIRADIPIAFSEGFSPHQIMSFANPLGIGVTSDGEYFDIELARPISSKKAVKQLNDAMVEGMEVVSFLQIAEEKKKTGMAIVAGADYLSSVTRGSFPENWKEQAEAFMEQDQILIVKKTKRSEKEVDIKPMIYRFEVREESLYLQVATGSVENLKPGLVMQAFANFLGVPEESTAFANHRLDLYADIGEEGERNLVTLESLGQVIEE